MNKVYTHTHTHKYNKKMKMKWIRIEMNYLVLCIVMFGALLDALMSLCPTWN